MLRGATRSDWRWCSRDPGVNRTTAAYIGVTGVDDLHEQCAAHGARIVTGLADHPWGLRDFVVEMPGGHRLALGERIAPPRLYRQEPGADHPNRSPVGTPHKSSGETRIPPQSGATRPTRRNEE